jgi:hypothetical protein
VPPSPMVHRELLHLKFLERIIGNLDCRTARLDGARREKNGAPQLARPNK